MPEQTNPRQTLLEAARKAGERYLSVRGSDLVAALTGQTPAPSQPTAQPTTNQKDR